MSYRTKYLRDSEIYAVGNLFLYTEDNAILGRILKKDISDRFGTINSITLIDNNKNKKQLDGRNINKSNFFRAFESPFYNILMNNGNKFFGKTIIDYCINKCNIPIFIAYYLGYGHDKDYLIDNKYMVVEGNTWNKSEIAIPMVLESLGLSHKEYIKLSYISKIMHRIENKRNNNENQPNQPNQPNQDNKNKYMSIFEKWLVYKYKKIEYVYACMKVNQFLRICTNKYKEKRSLLNINKEMSSYKVEDLKHRQNKQNYRNQNNNQYNKHDNSDKSLSRIKFYKPKQEDDEVEPHIKEWLYQEFLDKSGICYDRNEWQYVKAIKDSNLRDIEAKKIKIIEDNKRITREVELEMKLEEESKMIIKEETKEVKEGIDKEIKQDKKKDKKSTQKFTKKSLKKLAKKSSVNKMKKDSIVSGEECEDNLHGVDGNEDDDVLGGVATYEMELASIVNP